MVTIQEKLDVNTEFLMQTSQMQMVELKVLKKLIYKSKNAHKKEKFFQCLQRIKKSLYCWLDLKYFKNSKHEDFHETLDKIMVGGEITLRIILLCEEIVQYNLAYMARGFFVSLHVVFVSLISRLWVLQKDCWRCLVNCYQYILLLAQNSQIAESYNKYPKSLEVWLKHDVDCMLSRNCLEDYCQQQLQQHDMCGEKLNEGSLDLGEPVFDRKESRLDKRNEHLDKTDKEILLSEKSLDIGKPVVNRQQSRINLVGKLAMEDKSEGMLKPIETKEFRPKLKLCRSVAGALARKSFAGVQNSSCFKRILGKVFIRISKYRFTMLNLIMKVDLSHYSSRMKRVLLKFFRSILRERKLLSCKERRVVFRAECLLKKKTMKKREFSIDSFNGDGFSRKHRKNLDSLLESKCSSESDVHLSTHHNYGNLKNVNKTNLLKKAVINGIVDKELTQVDRGNDVLNSFNCDNEHFLKTDHVVLNKKGFSEEKLLHDNHDEIDEIFSVLDLL
ncbi:uncharacterized protein LOC124441152 isoform X2 [Xenia sp. Carnegie-2017]|uniref:uncharacterized protein LOC124441152 isoform X2 n=1 Tax=Xenia sp. Carnegie-2017 TaxID=2897299 RepID=UPI001F04D4F7|nr:uncharacterized protein LOC124441152 isoform X2 [Xenia sp. Carnegie-2017]